MKSDARQHLWSPDWNEFISATTSDQLEVYNLRDGEDMTAQRREANVHFYPEATTASTLPRGDKATPA
ncbi:hypothetical protein FRC15_005303 [Serendipita sp. 397]|nr:hypothetical protein FRC15_005303 [Serendipita sp. 397]